MRIPIAMTASNGAASSRAAAASTASALRLCRGKVRCLSVPRNNPADCLDDVVDIFIPHRGIDGQGNQPLVLPVSHREIVRLISIAVPIVSVKMNRNEMDRSRYVSSAQFFDEFIP